MAGGGFSGNLPSKNAFAIGIDPFIHSCTFRAARFPSGGPFFPRPFIAYIT
jgi:hypothetical protein